MRNNDVRKKKCVERKLKKAQAQADVSTDSSLSPLTLLLVLIDLTGPVQTADIASPSLLEVTMDTVNSARRPPIRNE